MRALTCVTVLFLTCVGPADASNLSLDFASSPGARIAFDPTDTAGGGAGTISFPNLFESDFVITGAHPIFGASVIGLLGNLDGTFEVGPIISGLGYETALVTAMGAGPHEFVIHDGTAGIPFTANVDWVNIVMKQSIGGLNFQGEFNINGIVYVGPNDMLHALLQGEHHTADISFQFAEPRSLHDIFDAQESSSTSYSGSLSAVQVPEPASLLLLLGTMACVGFSMRRKTI